MPVGCWCQLKFLFAHESSMASRLHRFIFTQVNFVAFWLPENNVGLTS